MNATADDWTHVEPILDDAMEALEDTDRAAVLLRYFQNKSPRDVGQELGVSEDAAQKRVSRAVERLREFFAKREVKVGAASLVAAISANAAQAVPVGLAATLTATVTAGVATAGAAGAATPMIAMTMVQKALVATTVVALAGVGIYEGVQVIRLRGEVRTLEAQQARLTGQIQQLQSELNDSSNQVSWLRDENERLNRNTSELLRLRGEVGVLRDGQAELKRLREDNVALQAALAEVANAAAVVPPEMSPQRQAAYERINDAKMLVLCLYLYGEDHEKLLPAQLSLSSNYWGDSTLRLQTNGFELVAQGSLSDIANPAGTIVLRERDATWIDDQWYKVYGFADGHVELVKQPIEGFENWEKHRMIPESK